MNAILTNYMNTTNTPQKPPEKSPAKQRQFNIKNRQRALRITDTRIVIDSTGRRYQLQPTGQLIRVK